MNEGQGHRTGNGNNGPSVGLSSQAAMGIGSMVSEIIKHYYLDDLDLCHLE